MDELRELERASIHRFVADSAPYLTGRVLDYGCGLSPYRDLVPGEYVGYDRPALPGFIAGGPDAPDPLDSGDVFDAILCTQVIQYVRYPAKLLTRLQHGLRSGGHLVMTGPTNWPVVEPTDRHRFTVVGITALLLDAGFVVPHCSYRAEVTALGNRFPLGWAALAVA